MDMTYNFRQDYEPTEAQLERLMREVAQEARKKKEKADKNFQRLIQEEIKLAAERAKKFINQ